jgi:MoaA/NifB/PqqE/SkfB family radical SAM enzyme
MNNVICSLPFNSVSIDPAGKLRQCCNSDAGVFAESVQTINTNGLINNSSIQRLRSALLQDKKDPICDRCWKMEDIGNKSFRHIANENTDHGIHTISPKGFSKTIGYENIRYLDISLGNKCNLACRMCHPGSSSLLAKQYIELKYTKDTTTTIEFDRSAKDKILELINQAPNLASIYLLGGEPLINDFHDEILELLIKLDRAKNVTIHYSTNLHTDVEKHLERWAKFKLVEMSVSIDGSDEVYEYIRWPGSWNKVYNNLKKVNEIASETRNIIPGIAVTAQNLNAGNIATLITKIQDIDKNLSFYFIPVTGCNYIDLTPSHILETAIKDISVLYDPYNRIQELTNYYKKALSNKNNIQLGTVKEFFKKQKDFDALRKQNLFQTLPYFIELANEYDIKTW